MKKRRFETTAEVDELLTRLSAERFAVPEDLVARAENHLATELRALRSRRKEVLRRLALASALTFPLVTAANAAVVWIFFSALDRFVPTPLAALATASLGGMMLLSLSLSYGSVPILASFGLRLREETT
jgi:hypothetical protein